MEDRAIRRSIATVFLPVVFLPVLLGLYGCAWVRPWPVVRQNPDQSLDYFFETNVTCHKTADYTRAIKTGGAIAVSTFFNAKGDFESRWENAKKASPTAEDVAAAFFDACYEYGAGRLSRPQYEKLYSDYNDIRKRVVGGPGSPPPDVTKPDDVSGDWDGFETEWLESNPAEGFRAVRPRKDKNQFTIKLAQNGEQISGKMALVNKPLEWRLSGYFRLNLMVLSYQNTSPASRGVGSVVLIRDDQGKAFAGYIIGVECEEGLFMQYPLVLMKNTDRDVAEVRFKRHLDQRARAVLSSRECPEG